MAAVSSRKEAGVRVRSERQRILQELIQSIEVSHMDALEMVEYGNLVFVIVAGHIKHVRVEANVQASNTAPGALKPVTATA